MTGARVLRRVAPQLLTLGAVILLVSVYFPDFYQIVYANDRLVGIPIDVVKRGAPVALLAIGMTLVIATRGIDLSVGAVMAICGATAAWSIDQGFGLWAALGLAGAAGLVCGLWNGILVAFFGIQPIVATLILMVAGRGVAQLITGGTILTFDNEAFAFLGSGAVFGVPVPTLAWILTGILFGLLVRRTALGLLIESIGINLRASTLTGINSRVLLLAVYMGSGFCAALAGIIATADIRGADANNAGLWLELDAILAVVIGGNSLLGGRFSILASLLGAMIIQTINTGILLAGFPPEFNLVIKAVLVIIILVLQSPRLLPRLGFIRLRRERDEKPSGTPVEAGK
ncbi:simple sugar transport system permease protein [Palleronia marisminoris]|uniref:Inner membrane ABC transporter permease protein YtfT n=1 Tax=Palleronia marisminoris TaxID=315423 RepID=A0A1Y5SQU2_9RHOB|nr:ABC transporter permease [Palleronia marisminoris]SFG94402.1 simple sugar transport system permease protein [Palleronia marisminoris]SLN46310.1 Inner membrane ABC transporter permease protein YtfT [Palleronia marisminoris]